MLVGIQFVEGVHRARRLTLFGTAGVRLVLLDELGPDSRLGLFRWTAGGWSLWHCG